MNANQEVKVTIAKKCGFGTHVSVLVICNSRKSIGCKFVKPSTGEEVVQFTVPLNGDEDYPARQEALQSCRAKAKDYAKSQCWNIVTA